MDGLSLIYKPAGMTSFTALKPLKKVLGTGKIGHAGTLDKFAEGLLLVLSGVMTRFVPFFMDLDKEYHAVFEFGKETDTLDPEGEIIKTGDVPSFDIIREKIMKFSGIISQIPPAYSAVHINGKRAYKLARTGETVLLSPRNVTVHDFNLVDYSPPFLRAVIRCSKGTYIRSLARDLGNECGSCSYVRELVRTRTGPFDIQKAARPECFTFTDVIGPYELLKQIGNIEIVHLQDRFFDHIKSGKQMVSTMFESMSGKDGLLAVFSGDNMFLSLLELSGGRIHYRFNTDNR